MMLQGTLSLATRGIIVALVLTAHVGAFFALTLRADVRQAMQHDLSVTFANAVPAQQWLASPQLKASNPVMPVVEQATEKAVAAVEQAPVEAAAAQAAVAAPPVIADTQPDYKAAYLNNPPPGYPMMARRNGLQGRVVLNVEVLANGSSGQITIQSSSGYAMLDNAALQTVKNWRFVPARHGGQVVDKWFMIPIQFSLKDNPA